jgi:hypothetical protein
MFVVSPLGICEKTLKRDPFRLHSIGVHLAPWKWAMLQSPPPTPVLVLCAMIGTISAMLLSDVQRRHGGYGFVCPQWLLRQLCLNFLGVAILLMLGGVTMALTWGDAGTAFALPSWLP